MMGPGMADLQDSGTRSKGRSDTDVATLEETSLRPLPLFVLIITLLFF